MLLAIALLWLLLREGVKMSCFLSLLFLHSSTLSQEKHSLCLSQIICSFPSLGSKEALVSIVVMGEWLDWMSLVNLSNLNDSMIVRCHQMPPLIAEIGISLGSTAWINSRNTHKCTGAELGRGWCPAAQRVFTRSFAHLEAACLSLQYNPSHKCYSQRPFQIFGNVSCNQFNQQQSILSQGLHLASSPSKAVSLPRKQGNTRLFWHHTEVGYFLSFSTSITCVNSHHAAEWGLSGNNRFAFWQQPRGQISLRLWEATTRWENEALKITREGHALLSVNQDQIQPRSNQAQFKRLLHYYCYYLSLELLEHLDEAAEMRVERTDAVQRYNESMAAQASTQAAEMGPATSRREVGLQLGISKISLGMFWVGYSVSSKFKSPSIAGRDRNIAELESNIGPLWSWMFLTGEQHGDINLLEGQTTNTES